MRGRVTPWFMLLLLLACQADRKHTDFLRDLDAIEEDTLRVLISPGLLGIDDRGSRISGLEYSLLSSFAEDNDLAVKFITAHSLQEMVDLLRCGDGDIAAGLLSEQSVASNKYMASCSYGSVDLHVVEMRADPWYGEYPRHGGFPAPITEYLSHPGPAMISHAQTSESVENVKPISLTPLELLHSVALGHVKKAAIPRILYQAYEGNFPHLKISDDKVGSIDLVFAVRNNSQRLKGLVDSWIGNTTNWPVIDALIAAHSHSRALRGSFSHPHHYGAERISAFDPGFKAAQDSIGWDWRLLAALAFKESRFDTTALSHRGAIGVMQLMPNTAAEMGMDRISGAAGPIMTGAKYLRTLERIFKRSVADDEERLAFALASYNVGPGHVMDAQRLARSVGLDPGKWHGNVERCILLKTDPVIYRSPIVKFGYCNGHHVFLFVREVLHYWKHYQNIGFQPFDNNVLAQQEASP